MYCFIKLYPFRNGIGTQHRNCVLRHWRQKLYFVSLNPRQNSMIICGKTVISGQHTYLHSVSAASRGRWRRRRGRWRRRRRRCPRAPVGAVRLRRRRGRGARWAAGPRFLTGMPGCLRAGAGARRFFGTEVLALLGCVLSSAFNSTPDLLTALADLIVSAKFSLNKKESILCL